MTPWQRSGLFTVALVGAVVLAACDDSAARLSASRYFPLVEGSWWEYETNDGPLRREVQGTRRIGDRTWTIVTERVLDGHRRLADLTAPRVDTMHYAVIDGAVHRYDRRTSSSVPLFPLVETDHDSLRVESTDTDTVPGGVFSDVLLIHHDSAGVPNRTIVLAAEVGLISDESAGRERWRALRAWRIGR